YQDCDTLVRCVDGTPMNIETLNSIFKRVGRDDYWRLRFDPQRMELLDYRDKTFPDFIRDPYPRGMGTDVATLRKLLDAEANVLLNVLLARAPGGANNPEGRNQHEKESGTDGRDGEVNSYPVPIDLPAPQRGKSRQGAIRTLHRAVQGKRRKNDPPYFPTPEVAQDLLGKISRSELTCNRAMKSLGYRPDPTPLEIVLKNLPKLDEADRLVVAQRLSELCQGKESP